jgi:hypothetical protein
MTHRLSLYVPQTLRQRAAVLARSVFVSEFSEHIFDRHRRISRAGNLSAKRASISYQPNRALSRVNSFDARRSRLDDSRRVALAGDRSTRSGHTLSNVNLRRTSTMFVPALSESSYLFRS